ncbi:bifunctional serine/threonine protein kinase/MFS transporter [Streptomyces sp. MB09-01]|uniref:bifunctional serine/threonine protein kinase/MFS transporter n=1 Tax=Streptomyces sp. MB09-01 TaxID=3028666 RepID=UPI0029A7C612|nr:bifunctional serine/threonine protein kinase/MFS transporter [Streptomyces sp. MB09-01]MDX3538837.1 bifunctional serine/threonine protein kinase/MFS transporter [Streptomyces sp. MB09-01]
MEQLTEQDPAHIGPYRLIGRLGAGGMGLVYLGRSDIGRTVAVKVVQAEHAQHPDFRRRFAREVAAARRVGGAWTADVLDADIEAAVPWVATQYIPGPDLTSVVARFGPLPERSVRTLANRLALALRAVHEAGLIHRDLKPSNVLITVDGPRVIDFGIVRAMDGLAGDSLHTRTGMLIGSPGFMSPEQVRGLELTPASDVFCLGALLVYAATGRLLFGATETGLNAHLFRIAEEEADLTGVPDSLLDLVRECLHKEPAKRPIPQEVAARTAAEQAGEWLPGAVLAELGRRAAHVLDYAPATPADEPAARPDPRVQPVQLLPPPPAHAPTAPARFGAAPAFGSPPGPLPGVWAEPASLARLTDPAAPLPGRWWGLLVIALAQLIVLSDAAVFNMPRGWDVIDEWALRGVQISLHDLHVMCTVYALAFVGLLSFGARIVDLVGHKRMLVISLVGFAVAATIGGTTTAYGALVMARGLQGAFAALVSASVPGLLSLSFTDPSERRKAFGIYVAIAGSGPALGLWAHWALPEWRWCLFAGISLAVIAAIGAAVLVYDRAGRIGARFDLLGVLLGSGGVGALVYGLTQANPYFPGVGAIIPVATGATLLAAFVWQQTRMAGALASPSGIRAQASGGSFLAMALVNVGAIALHGTLAFGWFAART